MERLELPLGFGMALAQRQGAMERFVNLSEAEQAAVLEKCHSVSSRQEMRALVNSMME